MCSFNNSCYVIIILNIFNNGRGALLKIIEQRVALGGTARFFLSFFFLLFPADSEADPEIVVAAHSSSIARCSVSKLRERQSKDTAPRDAWG